MNTCKKCGKSSKTEYCFSCYKEVNNLPKTARIPCKVCGKLSRGFMCKSCRSSTALNKIEQRCSVCSKVLGLSYVKGDRLCISCARKRSAEKSREARDKDKPLQLTCIACGTVFPYREVKSTGKPVKVCSLSCATRLKHILAGNTADTMIDRIKNLIVSKNMYMSESSIKAELGITRQQLRRYSIDTTQINIDLGFAVQVGDRVDIVRCDSELVAETRQKRGAKTFKHTTVLDRSDKAKELKDNIVSWLKKRGVKATIRDILQEFHIDYYSTWRKFGLDIADIHRDAGVYYSRTTSWHEQTVLEKARSMFGCDDVVPQKRFVDLLSKKGYPLRYDMFIKSRKCLIEVDGEQHYKDDHIRRGSCSTDDLKDRYAKDNGIALYRLRIYPVDTFDTRVHELLVNIKDMDVTKESGLLEVPPSKVEDNQQPIKDSLNCESDTATGKGSETIRKE